MSNTCWWVQLGAKWDIWSAVCEQYKCQKSRDPVEWEAISWTKAVSSNELKWRLCKKIVSLLWKILTLIYLRKELDDSFSCKSKGKRKNIRTFCSWKAEMITFWPTLQCSVVMCPWMIRNKEIRRPLFEVTDYKDAYVLK